MKHKAAGIEWLGVFLYGIAIVIIAVLAIAIVWS